MNQTNTPRDVAEHAFLNGFSAMTDITYKTHVEKGWTASAKPEDLNWRGNQFMLMVGELAEGHEAVRKELKDDKLTARLGEEVELADCIIRIMNYSRQRGLDVASALVEKARFNEGREYMHGGKKF